MFLTLSFKTTQTNLSFARLNLLFQRPPKARRSPWLGDQIGGISVEGSTSTAGSSHASPSSPTLSRPRSASENQAEIRRRLDEISSLMAQIEQPSTEITHIQELQNRIETLTEENTRLMGVPPSSLRNLKDAAGVGYHTPLPRPIPAKTMDLIIFWRTNLALNSIRTRRYPLRWGL